LDLKGVRILVVEDSWLLGINLKSLLRALGADVLGPVATTSDAERLISGHLRTRRSSTSASEGMSSPTGLSIGCTIKAFALS